MLFIILLAVSLCTGARGEGADPRPYPDGTNMGPQQQTEGTWLDSIFSFVTGPNTEVPGVQVRRSGGAPELYEAETYPHSPEAERDGGHVEHPAAGSPPETARHDAVSPPETPRHYAGRPLALPPRGGKSTYGRGVRPAVEADVGGGFSKFIGGILPNSYYSRPKFRYPYYDVSGKGYLLYGYGGKELYEYSVFKPLEGYF